MGSGSRERDRFVQFGNDLEAYRPCFQGTLKVHESKVFDHLELRVGEQVGDDELDCLPRRPSTMVKD